MSTMHDETKTIICKNCGAKIDPSLKFCQECGSKTPKFIALEQKVLEEWNMVRIPDNTTHKGLYFGKYQVTQAQWQAIMGYNPSSLYYGGDLSRPVESVSWNDCQWFIKKLNTRTEVKQA
ncbi:MAG: hypothetical protein J6V70_07665, partial [Kiritimatiellae bacterium]|nr:hypothetical protein [Kiritimatiellia bacterium]